ncbi:hypothetical protein [Bhargavaea ginsengi]|uniref:hypothetical protein n=1 Tax=Bhargavaea ginsengi TaxID=426757 RepID=UPI003C762DEC
MNPEKWGPKVLGVPKENLVKPDPKDRPVLLAYKDQREIRGLPDPRGLRDQKEKPEKLDQKDRLVLPAYRDRREIGDLLVNAEREDPRGMLAELQNSPSLPPPPGCKSARELWSGSMESLSCHPGFQSKAGKHRLKSAGAAFMK